MELRCESLTDLPQTVEQILQFVGNEPQVVLLEGDLGAGKTAFTKLVCERLGCKDVATSPTFSIINEYHGGSDTVFHIDLYRLNTLDEALGIGIDEYLYAKAWCFIEWPGLIRQILEPPYVHIQISVEDNDTRIFRILKYTTQASDE